MSLEKALEIGFNIGGVAATTGIVLSMAYNDRGEYNKSQFCRNLTYYSLIVMCSSLAALNIIDVVNE